MIESLQSLPFWLGCTLWIVFMCVVGQATYRVSSSLIGRSKKIPGRATNNLFRVVGTLFSLMLSLAFSSVVDESRDIVLAVKVETAAIADTLQGLDRYGDDPALEARSTALRYTQLVVEDDWPALSDDELGEEAGAALGDLADEVLALEPANAAQEERRSRILDDIDVMSDARRDRLNSALAEPPVFFYVLFVGFLLTMILFGSYPPQATFVVLLLIYSAFIGLLVYLIVALNDPFGGALGIDPEQFRSLLESQTTG